MNPAQIIFIVAFVVITSAVGALAIWFDDDINDVFEDEDNDSIG